MSTNIFYLSKVINGEKNYEDLNNHKIMHEIYFPDQNKEDEIEIFLDIIVSNKYDFRNISFVRNDIFIINTKYSKDQQDFKSTINYNNSLIVSIMAPTLDKAALVLKNIYKTFMKCDDRIKMIFFSKRSNKKTNTNNRPTFLIKMFLMKDEFMLLQTIFKTFLTSYNLKRQIENKDKDETTDGDKKKNWIDITNFILSYTNNNNIKQ